MKKLFLGLVLSCIIGFSAIACDKEQAKMFLANYKWLTEDYPPYNYLNQRGELIGISTEILLLVFQELGIDLKSQDILIVPWARLYYNLEAYDDYAAYSMVSTPEREEKFKLVAAPLKTKVSIMVLEERKAMLAQKPLKELNIAVVREDIGHQLLNAQNIPAKQVITTSANSMLQMLIRSRVDAIAYTEEVAMFQYNKLDLKKGKIVPLLTLDGDALYNFVFHKSTPECVTSLFLETMTRLHQKGDLTRIRDKYVGY